MADNSSQEVADLADKMRPLPQANDIMTIVSHEAWQLWLGLDFQVKLLILLLMWLGVNLLLIRFAWRIYGDRLSEILMKGKLTVIRQLST